MPDLPFERCVFVNCPFDDEYDPILQSILFCVVYLGFVPRLAKERSDSAELRINKITELIESSLYSIHDLSRCQSTRADEYFRLNMPFELGIDYACRKYHGQGRENKKLLILEEKKYRYQAALSDLAGCDIGVHHLDFQRAVRKVRNWLVSEANAPRAGAQKILYAYADFQEWYYEKQLIAGFSEDDIKDYPTNELLDAMQQWVAEGGPV